MTLRPNDSLAALASFCHPQPSPTQRNFTLVRPRIHHANGTSDAPFAIPASRPSTSKNSRQLAKFASKFTSPPTTYAFPVSG